MDLFIFERIVRHRLAAPPGNIKQYAMSIHMKTRGLHRISFRSIKTQP